MKNIVVKFLGDSGDGMQLTGSLFASLNAILGKEICTLPDFPAEIRAPKGTIGGVSGFQINLGSNVHTPGNTPDVLVIMNPAALKVCINTKQYHDYSIIIIDSDSFTKTDLEKANFTTLNPFTELSLPETVQIVNVPITQLTKTSLSDSGLDNKSILKSRNMFALGLIIWLFNYSIENAISLLENKFSKKQDILTSNIKVLVDGYNYGCNTSMSINQVNVNNSSTLKTGKYTSIDGNKATAFGLIAAAERANKQLFLGSYPITPATDIMQHLALRKDLGVKVVQAEDEIAGICTAIGASFAGDLAVTSTSGPGLSLKSEAIGLVVMAELPLVIIDVQRGGPSTGLPTKTEQGDLLQALYGRNGESPVVVLAASTSSNCFEYAYKACKIALENMTPVILLTDTYLANGTNLWQVPRLNNLDNIVPQSVSENYKNNYNPALRDDNYIRYFAYPGMEGYEHRNIGLERDCNFGTISTNPDNHQQMVYNRKNKIEQIANKIPLLTVNVNENSDTLLVSWGSTEGHVLQAATELNCAHVHFNYINPLPLNTEHILRNYKNIIVCELNTGQFASYLRSKFENINLLQYNEVTGQPITTNKLIKFISEYGSKSI